MPKCRFFRGSHVYDTTECDVEFCRQVLPMAGKRRSPLPEGHSPIDCEHDWDTLYVRTKAHLGKMVASRRFAITEEGQIELLERVLYVCKHCGSIKYTHEELGDIMCVPYGSTK